MPSYFPHSCPSLSLLCYTPMLTLDCIKTMPSAVYSPTLASYSYIYWFGFEVLPFLFLLKLLWQAHQNTKNKTQFL